MTEPAAPTSSPATGEDAPARERRTLLFAALAGAGVTALLALTVLVTVLLVSRDSAAPSANTARSDAPAAAKLTGPLAANDVAARMRTSKTPVAWLGAPKPGTQLRLNESATNPAAGALDVGYLDPAAQKAFTAQAPTFTVRVTSAPIAAGTKLADIVKALPKGARRTVSKQSSRIVSYLPPKGITGATMFPFVIHGKTPVIGQVIFVSDPGAAQLRSAARTLNLVVAG